MAGTDCLQGHVAVVTGAAGLLGRQHALALAEAGAHVCVTDVDAEACLRLAGSISESTSSRILPFSADLTDRPQVTALRDALLERFGRIDVLVNNAAINESLDVLPDDPESSRFENLSIDTFRRTLEVNVLATFSCCQILGQEMVRQRRGSIINIASTYGIVAPNQSLYLRPDGTQPFYKSAAYPTSKGAVLAFTRFLAAYWGKCGVRVNCLSPGGVAHQQADYFVQAYGERTPLGRMANPDEYRGAILFLASDASTYVTGANLVADGGFTIW